MTTLNKDLGLMLMYAARYAHTRKTGAALQIVSCILRNWDSLSDRDKSRLQMEASEATCNFDDWAKLKEKAI